VVILGSNKSINSVFGEILAEEFGRVPVQIDPNLKLCPEGVKSIRASRVVIVDLSSINRNSKLFIKQVHELCPQTNILALHIYKEDEYIKPLIKAGASTYLLVNTEKTKFIAAMRKLLNGNKFNK
jgi:DNA-binding NarL/FixJ family response regulator